MALAVGARLGHYAVTAKLGEGGMGEVWEATDTKLNRQVALKILPEALAADPDRLARFQREAQVLASLNHPGIAAIYGVEETEDTLALVLELVEGPTLANRIKQGPIPVDEALPIANQIAIALEAAHEQGIIHRDLKPANVKVKDDGVVKVLDFGLAKALNTAPEGNTSQSPTLTAEATATGVIMGTATYMAPEQAKGRSVDRRVDVWAFGVVLYEMLTGRRAFAGEDEAETLANVIKTEADWSALPPDVSPTLATFLRRCLEKEPKHRVHDVADVRLAISGAFEPVDYLTSAALSTPRVRVWQRAAVMALLVVGTAAVSSVVTWRTTREVRTGASTIRFSVPLPLGGAPVGEIGRGIALSPDGQYFAYLSVETGGPQVHLRPMGQAEATPIRGTEASRVGAPFFSPDSQWLGFWAENQLRKVPVTGGAPVLLGEWPHPYGASWGTDDVILFGQGPEGIWQVSGSGGTAERVIPVEDGALAATPSFLPGGEWVLFTLRSDLATDWDQAQVVAQSLVTGERRVLIRSGRDARYVATGHLVYVLNNDLVSVLFDPATLRVAGNPVRLIEGIANASYATGEAQFGLAQNGTLAYMPESEEISTRRVLGWVDGMGDMTPLLPRGGGGMYAPQLSPDERQVTFAFMRENAHVWLYDIESGRETRLTQQGHNVNPVWTPDGTRVTYVSGQALVQEGMQLYWQAADGGDEPQRLLDEPGFSFTESWAPDSKTLVYTRRSQPVFGETNDIWVLELGAESRPFLATDADEHTGRVSPNGEWLAYVSDRSGEDQVYVQPFPDGGPVTLLSDGVGTEPVWSRDGTELFYRDGLRMLAVQVQTDGPFRAGRPQVLFEGSFHRLYDVASDGRFLMVQMPSVGPQIQIVTNWFQELMDRVPVN